MNALGKFRTKRELQKHNSNSKTIIKDTPGVLKYPRIDYNCFGYALGYYDWLDLDAFFNIADSKTNSNIEELNAIFEDCCMELEERYQLTRVYNINTLKLNNNQHLIAFRIGYDDFHFCRLGSDGIWSHKPGGNYIRTMEEKEFIEAWCPHRSYPYISNIGYFIVEKGSKWYE
jgi:hypothetical protein